MKQTLKKHCQEFHSRSASVQFIKTDSVEIGNVRGGSLVIRMKYKV